VFGRRACGEEPRAGPWVVEEGLDALMPVFSEEIMMCYAELGDEERFRVYAEETLQRVIKGAIAGFVVGRLKGGRRIHKGIIQRGGAGST